MSTAENLQLMKTLDDAWNAQDWETFNKRHTEDTDVFWPGQKDPTHGRDAHRLESVEFFKSIENHIENDPYQIQFGQGEWTCTVARWRGKMVGPMKTPDGRVVPPTGKTFDLEFCTVARWKDGEIVEERLFYDQISFLKQIGVM
jgi:ketosteroid isomerase-like protein